MIHPCTSSIDQNTLTARFVYGMFNRGLAFVPRTDPSNTKPKHAYVIAWFRYGHAETMRRGRPEVLVVMDPSSHNQRRGGICLSELDRGVAGQIQRVGLVNSRQNSHRNPLE